MGHFKTLTLLFLLALWIFSCSTINNAKEEGFVGHWLGDSKYGNTSLQFAVDISKNDSVYTAFFSSRDQRALNIPSQNLRLFKDSVHFELRGDKNSWVFDGKLEQSKISGQITKGTETASFLLNKTNLSPPNHTVTEVVFQNDTVILAGTLRLPNTKTAVPAILFLHGSGGEQRFSSEYMADFFAAKGIATLNFDKRGSGKSTGNWLTSSFQDLANDAIAGIKFLQNNPRINSHKIGIYGHSQGGSICPMVLNMDPEISFGVSAASAGVSMAESDWYEVQNRFRNYVSGKDYDNAMSVMERYLQFAATGNGYQELMAEAKKYRDEQWYQDYIGEIDSNAVFFKFYRNVGRYNPVEQWKNVKQPCLILKGESDQTSPGYPTFQNIEDALKQAGNNQYRIVRFPNTTHEMQLMGKAQDFWFKATPGYCDTIFNWIKNTVID
jgi:uncharacterized protein